MFFAVDDVAQEPAFGDTIAVLRRRHLQPKVIASAVAAWLILLSHL